MIGDGDTMGAAAEIVQDVLWSGEGPLGVDDPIGLTNVSKVSGEGRKFAKAGEIASELKRSSVKRSLELLEE
jgi:hypothetical protein